MLAQQVLYVLIGVASVEIMYLIPGHSWKQYAFHARWVCRCDFFRWQYPVVYTIIKHSHSQVGSWTNTSSLLPWAMLILLNNRQVWWQWDCHTITFIKDWTANPPRCSHKLQPQQAVDYLADSFASLSWAMLMLRGDKQWKWSCHYSRQGLYSNTPWCMPSQSTDTAKLVAGLALCLYFLERCWCSSTTCHDDGNTRNCNELPESSRCAPVNLYF